MRSVGRSVPRKEGLDKARGRSRYVDDLRFPGMLHGRTIRTPVARGELIDVHLGFDRTQETRIETTVRELLSEAGAEP